MHPRDRDDFGDIARRGAGKLMDHPCPHGGGVSMKLNCHRCVVRAMRQVAIEAAAIERWNLLHTPASRRSETQDRPRLRLVRIRR